MTDQPTPAIGVPVCYRHPDRESHIRCQRCNRPICPDCMRDAAVGFQCPSCVAEGKKSTRAGRTAYGGLRPSNASITSFVLIGINAVVWLMIVVTGGTGSRLVDWLALRPNGLCLSGEQAFDLSQSTCTAHGGTWLPGVVDGAYWQLITSAFAHVEPWHIGFNMLALYVLGPQLEMVIGRARFLALYLLSALTGSALVYWAAPEFQATLGASGAIFGLMGALLVVAFKVRANVQQILMWIGINFVFTVVVSNISWQGHLGGFVGGILIAGVLVYAPKGPRRSMFQVSGLVVIGALTALAIIARTAALA
ncbi:MULTISPECIES: rhomboid family intramembrane serine protease [unclassified Nocardioides]|uniref:rhomboid family intramembrane serine protease n=1 Tax=unclassified Nocardioides TaxID=2615069 RepID=UPI0009F09DCC|nr:MULTISPECIES: rhomboid family intramembrane serine protease [unclassified Nocardioides]GAW47910.1 rhomboid family protein [Nocardioides sp. PD653-B2]GAW53787.1 rhomboid family protein [Nocardioides sp. PD653]